MSRNRRQRVNPFRHPASDEFDFEPLIVVLRECPATVEQLRSGCGVRDPLNREAEALVAQIDAVAASSRVPNEVHLVAEAESGHRTPKTDGR